MATTLVLLRHGVSDWNEKNLFTGWVDVALSDKGIAEARAAGRLLRQAGIVPDVLHTSVLRRAVVTANLALEQLGLEWLPVRRSWRLNERHYGALQGLDKREVAGKYGQPQVFAWRRSYDVRPPELARDDERHPARDPRYRELAPDLLPPCECLRDVVARLVPYWHDAIVPELRAGRVPLVVAHGNSLRALVKHLDGIADADIAALDIPTGLPLVYELGADLRPLGRRYLGDPEAAAQAAAVAKQAG
ncbi:MAG: 2,3-diphosphoglycerate-dependent phosphoglycerate mutase [Polyangiaceae bacterium]|nr:2,3-diphosphoglycerate-dependent phosphoglycerate mutase [Polyangiaceae bacterium]